MMFDFVQQSLYYQLVLFFEVGLIFFIVPRLNLERRIADQREQVVFDIEDLDLR